MSARALVAQLGEHVQLPVQARDASARDVVAQAAPPASALRWRMRADTRESHAIGAIGCAYAQHHPHGISDEHVVVRDEFPNRHGVRVMLHAPQRTKTQEFRELPRIDPIALRSRIKQAVMARITHEEIRHAIVQNLVQPARKRTLLHRHGRTTTVQRKYRRNAAALVGITVSCTTRPSRSRMQIDVVVS